MPLLITAQYPSLFTGRGRDGIGHSVGFAVESVQLQTGQRGVKRFVRNL